MVKIILIGKNGQVGSELNSLLSNLGDLISLDRTQFDLTKPQVIREIIAQAKPDFIVNAAAYTAVDKAEYEPELAHQINAIAPQILAEECQKIRANLIHISTDYVFNGNKNTPYLESDLTNPTSVYGKTKLSGEENIKKISPNYIIIRTAWVYGIYGQVNFVKTMLKLGAEKEKLKVVIDQIGCPTYAYDLAKAIKDLMIKFKPEKEFQETYNFTNLGVISWYDFAVTIFEEARKLGYVLKVKEIIPITTLEYPTPAQRPAYSVLSNQKISTKLGYYPPYWRNSLQKMLKNAIRH